VPVECTRPIGDAGRTEGNDVSRRGATSGVLSDAIAGWLAEEALGSSEPAALFEALCRRLRASGISVMRANVSFNVLHPLYVAGALTWTAEGVDVRLLDREGRGSEEYQQSPIHHVITHALPLFRRRLTGRTALLDFPILPELRDRGGHDYLLLRVPFDGRQRGGFGDHRGIVCSWVSDRPSGFTDGEISLLQRITSRLAVALKGRLERSIADNVASAYLGKAAGQAVLSGAIHRGDGEKIQAALWYSDLRHSSALADHDTAEGFLSVLNRYFEMTAGAIRDHGGEVVSFIGDAVLGFFRVDVQVADACARALDAAEEARRRLAAHQPEAGAAPLEFGIGLHLGQVIYGNVGVPDRLQFTLVGSAVNEVARLEDLTKTLGCPLVASAPFAHELARDWRPLGEHALRGIANTTEVFTILPPEQ
jgi:adenylate cyclase